MRWPEVEKYLVSLVIVIVSAALLTMLVAMIAATGWWGVAICAVVGLTTFAVKRLSLDKWW